MNTVLLNVEVMKQLGWQATFDEKDIVWIFKKGERFATMVFQGDFKSYTNGARDFCGDLNAAWPLWVEYVENGPISLREEMEDEIFCRKTPEAAAAGIVKVWLGFKGVDVEALTNGQD